MIKVRTSAWVPGTPEDVFSFFDDPDNMLEFTPGAQRISRMERAPDGRLTYTVAMLSSRGKEFPVEVEQLVRNPPRHLTTRSQTSGFTATHARDFAPENGGTRVTSVFAAQIHRQFLGPLLELLQRDRTRLEADAIMQAVVQRFAGRQ
jgi:carbon monoxide dehydrogenase subunit G